MNALLKETNRARARGRYEQQRHTDDYKQRHHTTVQFHRHMADFTPELRHQLRKKAISRSNSKPVRLTARQQYWARRRRLLAVAQRRTQQQLLMKKMQSQSHVSALDIELLFNKANKHVSNAAAKVSRLHTALANKVRDCLEFIPNDGSATESDLTTAFMGVRIHCATSEPYFWENSSRVLPPSVVVPMDSEGRSHIFKSVEPTLSLNENDDREKSSAKWECHTDICSIRQKDVHGTIIFLQKLSNTSTVDASKFYLNMDSCRYETRHDYMGHAVHCSSESLCSSLLRPAKILSCHYPYLRSLLRRVYEVRRLSLAINAVKGSMSSGNYSHLEAAIELLDDIVQRIRGSNQTNADDDDDGDTTQVTEESIIQQFGKSLRQVAELRDNYTTTACDICEQLRSDIRTLKSYEHCKGFDSRKMEEAIELLYTNKTLYEDVDKFLENTMICKYCFDKLRGNKDIARSAFNSMKVEETPNCIAHLNLFERNLIKFCMTCVTIVRLGQISNKTRPRNELTSALKGRIAYLPVDVSATARFLPEKLLNIDSLVLLVGGQPTQKRQSGLRL